MATYEAPNVNGHATETFRTSAGNTIVAPRTRKLARSRRRGRLSPMDGSSNGRNALAAPYSGARLHTAPTIGQDFFASRHPIRQLTERMHPNGLSHSAQLAVFHAMREFVPTLDAAIKNRRALEGELVPTSDDEGLQQVLRDFYEEVAVGYIGGRATHRGLGTYLDAMAESADEYGLSAGEIVTDGRGTEIERLVVPNTRTLSLEDQDQDGLHELYQQQESGPRRLDNEPFVQVLSFTHSTEEPWPRPMAWSLVKSTEVILRMYEAVVNGWWRFGDPSMLFGIEYGEEAQPETKTVTSDDSAQEVPVALVMLKNSIEAVMKARRQGKVGDSYVWADGGEIKSEILGDIDASLMKYFKEQSSIFDAHIVTHSETPVWMYPHIEQEGDGLGSARSNNQAMIYSTAARQRTAKKERLAKEILDTFLLLQGDGRYVGQYELEHQEISIVDDKLLAETREIEANAEATEIENVVQAYTEEGERRFSGEAEQRLEEAGIY